MKVISLTQPWATLWVCGLKRIETRGFGTEYRGRVAVAATKVPNYDVCFADPFRSALDEIGVARPSDLPLAALLGWVDLVDVREMQAFGMGPRGTDLHRGGRFCLCCDERLTPRERAFGLYAPGRRAWITGRERFIAARSDPVSRFPGPPGPPGRGRGPALTPRGTGT